MPIFYAYFRKWFFGGLLLFLAVQASGQEVVIRGTVFNMYKTHPLASVSVISSSGRGTVTDENGNYAIRVNEGDSLSFSYLGRSTQMFPVREMNHITGFDIALHVNPTVLNEVHVAPRDYHMDSLQNRIDYRKAFNYKRPGLALTSPGSGLGVGLDLDALIGMLKFRDIRRAKAFQSRLVEDEEDKFVDHRFSRYTVKKVTRLDGNMLDSFMLAFRPSYHFAKTASDYDFLDYIKLAYEEFQLGLEGKEN